MKKTTLWIASGAVLFGFFFGQRNLAQTEQPAPTPHKKFQLVYSSDTRGYYRPCG